MDEISVNILTVLLSMLGGGGVAWAAYRVEVRWIRRDVDELLGLREQVNRVPGACRDVDDLRELARELRHDVIDLQLHTGFRRKPRKRPPVLDRRVSEEDE